MITPTHAVINAVVARRSSDRTAISFRSRVAFVVGGVAPDLALYVLSLAAVVYYPVIDGVSVGDAHERAMYDLYFNSPWWLAGHNLLHAPIILLALIAGASLLKAPWRRRVRFFAVGALLHSVIDILVHHDDGPLVCFPVSWSIRFVSPVSYWDPDHFGWFLRPIDLAITVAGAVWLIGWWRSRRSDSFEADGFFESSRLESEVDQHPRSEVVDDPA